MNTTYYQTNPKQWAICKQMLLDEAFGQDEGKQAILMSLYQNEWNKFCDSHLIKNELPTMEEILYFFKQQLANLPLLFTERGKQYQIEYNNTIVDCEILNKIKHINPEDHFPLFVQPLSITEKKDFLTLKHHHDYKKSIILNYIETELLWRSSCMDNTQYFKKNDALIYFDRINSIHEYATTIN